jgi:hypothetical protein
MRDQKRKEGKINRRNYTFFLGALSFIMGLFSEDTRSMKIFFGMAGFILLAGLVFTIWIKKKA